MGSCVMCGGVPDTLPTTRPVWTGSKMIHVPALPKPYPNMPGWVAVACGCCNGIAWGGDYPQTCGECGGNGWYAVHLASGKGALWPGGPFNGAQYEPDLSVSFDGGDRA